MDDGKRRRVRAGLLLAFTLALLGNDAPKLCAKCGAVVKHGLDCYECPTCGLVTEAGLFTL